MKGFSGLIGNPPYLGGSKISNLYGSIPSKVLRKTYDGGAKADLIAYFTKNGFSMLGLNGYMGMVTTNALRSGESRNCGLAPLLKKKSLDGKNNLNAKASRGRITNASTDIVWPGDAAVTVDLITIKNEALPIIGSTEAVLNQTPVNRLISSRLNLRPDKDPVKIEANKTISQRGVNPRGRFQITSEQYDLFVKSNAANSDILKPWLSGDDINGKGKPTKFIIDANNLQLNELSQYPEVEEYLVQNVKVKRDELDQNKPEYDRLRTNWWKWEFAAPTISEWFDEHEVIFAKGRVSTRWIIGEVDKGPIISEGAVAFFFEDHAMLAVLQSFLHEDWSREFGSTLGSDGHRYTNNCIETFPFPPQPDEEALAIAREQAKTYLQLRTTLCETLDCTINELHKYVDDSNDSRDEVVAYRTATVELDKTAMQLYGMPTEGYNRVHREDLGRFFPTQEITLKCFDILMNMNSSI